jgi:hypothetical protein
VAVLGVMVMAGARALGDGPPLLRLGHLLPFVPGMLVIYAAVAQEQDGSSWLLGLVAFAALLAAGHCLTRLAAKRLGQRRANLEAALGE